MVSLGLLEQIERKVNRYPCEHITQNIFINIISGAAKGKRIMIAWQASLYTTQNRSNDHYWTTPLVHSPYFDTSLCYLESSKGESVCLSAIPFVCQSPTRSLHGLGSFCSRLHSLPDCRLLPRSSVDPPSLSPAVRVIYLTIKFLLKEYTQCQPSYTALGWTAASSSSRVDAMKKRPRRICSKLYLNAGSCRYCHMMSDSTPRSGRS